MYKNLPKCINPEKKRSKEHCFHYPQKYFLDTWICKTLLLISLIFWVRIFSWFEFESHPWRPKGGPQKFVNKIQNKGHRSQKRFRL